MSTISVASTIQIPDIVVTGLGSEAVGLSQTRTGVSTFGIPIGGVNQEVGMVVSNDGDTLILNIRPESGRRFMIQDGFVGLELDVFWARDRAPAMIGVPIETNMTTSVTFNGLEGGSLPSLTLNNSFFESPAPTGAPPAYTGAIISQGGWSGIVPFNAGGDVKFDSVTITMTNLIPVNWDDQAIDNITFATIYNNNSLTSGLSIVTVPEPSSLLLLALGAMGISLTRKRRS